MTSKREKVDSTDIAKLAARKEYDRATAEALENRAQGRRAVERVYREAFAVAWELYQAELEKLESDA